MLSHLADFLKLASSWIANCTACMGGCVGVFKKSPPVRSVEKSRKHKAAKRGSHGHGPPQKDWWSSSSNDMDNNLTNSRSSQRSTSSISGVNHSLDSINAANNGGYINNALTLWTEQRRLWIGDRQRNRSQDPREAAASWRPTYDDLLSNHRPQDLLATNRPFPQPIPLPDMIDFLVDVWEQEGLYD
ncbi:hypothetical protein SELMODRAFT_156204 [Selaginella moellendorffii]|uniref:Gag1-like clamp domain-containing protein n=1 Tax=Selaginella moellendorffii TaxID=88036 RepID=D8SKM1_SELML|nr:uncharacterized protein LOC9644574 [Selaginella moellendorffii]EFJ15005.1 hypothetical protein SELMODRAFT_156204 [Selaginella moellendorffii]|eukprot:XP_002983993.1 uncharacterized protein LOC9644574 [Selaginella moellendorffii]